MLLDLVQYVVFWTQHDTTFVSACGITVGWSSPVRWSGHQANASEPIHHILSEVLWWCVIWYIQV